MILFFIISIQWEFNFKELENKISNSFSIPIFVICYVPNCKKCKQITTEFKEFITSTNDRDDIYISKINCLESEKYCNYFNATLLPKSYLVIGNNSRYWPQTSANTAEEWNDFIDHYIRANTKKIQNENQLMEYVNQNTMNGGTTFLLKIKDNDDESLRKVRRQSYHYLIYNITFFYAFDQNLMQYEFYTFYSYKCSLKLIGNNSMLTTFINNHKFGPTHHFDLSELESIQNNKFLLIVNHDDLSISQKKNLIKIVDKYCNKIVIGWIKYSEIIQSQAMKEKLINITHDMCPFVMIYNSNNYAFSYMRLSNITESLFVDKFLNKELKDGEIFGKVCRQKNITKTETKVKSEFFSLSYIIFGLLIIALLRLKDIPESKIE